MSRITLTEPKHEQLDDELLSNVFGGSGSRSPNHGGNGGGDGLGWLRHLLRAILR